MKFFLPIFFCMLLLTSSVWAQDVEVGGRVLLRLNDPKKAVWLSQKIEGLILQGTDPKQLHLEKKPKLILVCWGKQTLIAVTKELAEENKSEPLALARGWLESIKEVAELGFLKISPAHLEMPINGEATVEVSGLAQGPFLMGDSGGRAEIFEDGPTRLKVVAKSVGKAKVILQRGKARIALFIHVKDWAGYPPEQITVKVTGDPAPADMVLDAALRSLAAQSRVNPGCRLSTPKVPDSLPSIPSGKELRFSLPIRIAGNDDYYPVSRDIPIVVRSLELEAVEPNLLLVSNRPEMLDKDGVLLNYTIKASEPSRLMYSHMNGSAADRHLWVNLSNPGNSTVEALVDWSYAGPSRNEVLAGHEAAMRFGERLTHRSGFVLPIAPHTTVELAAHDLKRRELLSGFVNLRLLSGDKMQIQVLNKLSPGRNDGSPLANLGAPFNPFKIHPHGVFAQPFFEEWLDYKPGLAPLEFNFGESPWLIDFETGLPNTGNFGVLYRWHVTLTNPSTRTARFGLSFTPKNGAAAGTFIIDGKVHQATFKARNEETPLELFTVEPRRELNIDVLTFPEASSSYPATLSVRELRSGETFGAQPLMRSQKTLARTVHFEGVGIHGGSLCRVRVEPAPIDSGIVFVSGGVRIPALVDYVTRCERSTVLGSQGQEVSTVEHLLASVAAHHLSNLEIHVDGGEVPILDGSALPFYKGLEVIEQAAEQRVLDLTSPVWVGSGDTCIIALPHREPLLEYALHYDHPLIGCQQCSFAPWQGSFARELAPAGTFALWEEVQVLLDRGLAKGGSLDNALIAHQDHWSRPLRLDQEPVRHKCMDLLGDLSLLGYPLRARIIAVRAGHRWHVELVRKLQKELQNVNR